MKTKKKKRPAAPALSFALVLGYVGYKVDSLSRVYSSRRGAWRTLKASTDDRGRHFVSLTDPTGRVVRWRVSRLVLTAFRGPCPSGQECCHNEGDETCDHLDKTRWGTRLENCADKIRHGTQPRGSRDGNARLIEEQVADIKRRLVAGETESAIATRFGMRQGTISQIARDVTWQHVPWPGKRPIRQRSRTATHCVRGHEMSVGNTYIAPNGWRTCRECRKSATRRYRGSVDATA